MDDIKVSYDNFPVSDFERAIHDAHLRAIMANYEKNMPLHTQKIVVRDLTQYIKDRLDKLEKEIKSTS